MDLLTQILVFSSCIVFVSGQCDSKYENVSLFAFDPKRDVFFRLFTKYNKNINKSELITNGDDNSLAKSHFDRKKSVKMIIHGWRSDGVGPLNELIMEAFLNILDVNIITVDWSKGAKDDYFVASGYTQKVGCFVASFIEWLINRGTHVNNFHIIGHSLGAHVSGMVGRSIKIGKIPYISALDPAAPGWIGDDHVNVNDTSYLEVIHTNAKSYGIRKPLGHNDFYPNGGETQPGCETNDACSHSRAYMFFASSIDNKKFLGIQCKDAFAATRGDCHGPDTLHMGGSKVKKTKGIFYLKTTDKPPYYVQYLNN